jgi:hypothetical protein
MIRPAGVVVAYAARKHVGDAARGGVAMIQVPLVDEYHWAPLQNDHGRGPFFGVCGRTVTYFYTDPADFLVMPVRRCAECEGILEVGAVLIGALSIREILTFLGGGLSPRAIRPQRSGRAGPTWAGRALARHGHP